MSFLKKLILNYVLKKYKDKIRFVDILESPFIGNNKCHYNAISYLKLHKLEEEYRIVGGIQIFEDEIVIHFLLENIENNQLIDPTYGNLTDRYYGFVKLKEYNHKDFKNPDTKLYNLKKEFHKSLPWYFRFLTSYRDF
jgi:hypothetical protein